MKIVILDGYTENPGDLSWAGLEAFGEVKVYDRVSYVESPIIAETIGDADVAITNKTPISKETIDKCPNLKFIAVLATGKRHTWIERACIRNTLGKPVCHRASSRSMPPHRTSQ